MNFRTSSLQPYDQREPMSPMSPPQPKITYVKDPETAEELKRAKWEIEHLRQTIADKEYQIQKLNTKVSKLEQKILTLESENRRLSTELVTSKSKCSNLKALNQQGLIDHIDSRRKISELKSTINVNQQFQDEYRRNSQAQAPIYSELAGIRKQQQDMAVSQLRFEHNVDKSFAETRGQVERSFADAKVQQMKASQQLREHIDDKFAEQQAIIDDARKSLMRIETQSNQLFGELKSLCTGISKSLTYNADGIMQLDKNLRQLQLDNATMREAHNNLNALIKTNSDIYRQGYDNLAKYIEFTNHQQEVSRQHMHQQQMLEQARTQQTQNQLSYEMSRMSQQIQNQQYSQTAQLQQYGQYLQSQMSNTSQQLAKYVDNQCYMLQNLMGTIDRVANNTEYLNDQQRKHIRYCNHQYNALADQYDGLKQMWKVFSSQQYANMQSLPAPDDYSAKGNRVIVEEIM